MRQEQYERLQALEEKLVDVVLRDTDPANWSADGKPPKDMTQQERGDALWCRRIAMGGLAVLTKVNGLLHGTQVIGGAGNPQPPTPAGDQDDGAEDPLDKEIATAEHEAARLMKRMKDRGGA